MEANDFSVAGTMPTVALLLQISDDDAHYACCSKVNERTVCELGKSFVNCRCMSTPWINRRTIVAKRFSRETLSPK